jgi:hypothetical protein
MIMNQQQAVQVVKGNGELRQLPHTRGREEREATLENPEIFLQIARML